MIFSGYWNLIDFQEIVPNYKLTQIPERETAVYVLFAFVLAAGPEDAIEMSL